MQKIERLGGMLKNAGSVLIIAGCLGACAHLKHQDHSAGGPSTSAPVPAVAEQQSPVNVPAPRAAPQAPAPQPPPSQPGIVAKPAPPPRAVSTPKPAPSKPAATAAMKPAAGAATAPKAANTSKPELDFKAMEQRLRDTSSIGVFTKLSIKNQADDLLNAFRGFYAGHVPPTLDDLHGRFDGLVLKVVTLVQNDDATLASSISASRGAIWEKLSNKESFMSL